LIGSRRVYEKGLQIRTMKDSFETLKILMSA